jgi:hypothetical protein
MCTFVEHGGHGGSAAAPIAKVVLEKFFGKQDPNAPATAPAAATGRRKRRH